MVQAQVIEGTLKEIQAHLKTLNSNKKLTLIVPTENEQGETPRERSPLGQKGRELKPEALEERRIARIKSARGKYAHLGVSSEDLHRERAVDKEREERQISGDKS